MVGDLIRTDLEVGQLAEHGTQRVDELGLELFVQLGARIVAACEAAADIEEEAAGIVEAAAETVEDAAEEAVEAAEDTAETAVEAAEDIAEDAADEAEDKYEKLAEEVDGKLRGASGKNFHNKKKRSR